MKRKPAPNEPRKGIRVYVGMEQFDYPNATSWGIDQNGILGVGVPGPRQDQNGQPINDTISAFKEWTRVGWIKAQ